MKVNVCSGLLESVQYHVSPHCDARPQETVIDMVVVHNISLPPGQFGGVAVSEFFCGQLDYSTHSYFNEIAHLKVSTHLFIRRDGGIIQFVPFTLRAWHAGVSHFRGRERCNDFSIGIELEGTDAIPYEQKQYTQLVLVLKELMRVYPDITLDRIVGHSDIAPERKTDPGELFDWIYLRGLLA